jgi:hypothetical protein
MLLGAAILNAMSHNPLSASAFCLSEYNDLAPVEESLGGEALEYPQHWNQIEIRYGSHTDFQSGPTNGSGIFPARSGSSVNTSECDGIDCHFIICDGHIGDDGQIQSTASWLSQFVSDYDVEDPPELSDGTGQTICICIATSREGSAPSDLQMRRAEALVEELCRRFRIEPEAIRYPSS